MQRYFVIKAFEPNHFIEVKYNLKVLLKMYKHKN